MSQSAQQLVIYFVCGHKEMTRIDTDRSTQQNRNFWSRVKKWSSTTPAEIKYQQSDSLCERCLEIEKRQIEEAAELQARMAANAAAQLAAQKRRLAAPPAQGVNATIAALAFPNDKTIIETLRSAQLNASGQEELQLVDNVDWQGPAALSVQRDLDCVVGFWEKLHSEHAGRVNGITSRSGPQFCPQCKKMESSLADPAFRRQTGLSDVKLSEGIWYGTDDIVEDPWSTESPFAPIEDPLQPSQLQQIISDMPKAHPGGEEHEPPSQEINKRLPALDRLADMRDLTSRAPVHDFIQQANHEPEPSESPGNLYDSQSRAHVRGLGLTYLKIQETRRKAQLEWDPPAEDKNIEKPGPAPLKYLPSRPLDFGFMGPLLDWKLHRIAFSAMAKSLPPLPPQDGEELEALEESGNGSHLAQEPVSRDPTYTNWIVQPLGMPHREKIKSIRKIIRSDTVLELPQLPPQDEAELEDLESDNGGQSHNTISRDTETTVDGSSLHLSTVQTVQTPDQWPLGETTFEPEESIESEQTSRPSQWSRRSSSSHDPPLINPFSPLGIQVVQKIRDFFHIPSHIGPSGFKEFWYKHPRMMTGMTEIKALASRASTTRRSTRLPSSSGTPRFEPSDLLDEIPWLFGENVFLLNSRDDDIQKRIDMSELCDRVQWHNLDESWEEAISDWEGDEDDEDEDEDELVAKRNAAADRIFEQMRTEPLDAPVDLSFDTSNPDLPPRPDTPTADSPRLGSYRPQEPQTSYEAIDHFYSDSDSDGEGQEETQSKLVVISAAVSEDPESPHNVRVRSMLRNELVLNDEDESKENEYWIPEEEEGVRYLKLFLNSCTARRCLIGWSHWK